MDSHDAVTKYQSSVLLISNGKYPGGASDLAPLECADPDKVEMRKAKPEGSDWVEVGESDGPKRFYSQGGLTKGEKYQYRVRSVNKAGPSEPSEPTPYLIAKPRKCK